MNRSAAVDTKDSISGSAGQKKLGVKADIKSMVHTPVRNAMTPNFFPFIASWSEMLKLGCLISSIAIYVRLSEPAVVDEICIILNLMFRFMLILSVRR